MESFLKYRDKSYFNESDYYLMETLYGFRVTKVKTEGGKAWATSRLFEMMHSVKCVNSKELVGLKVSLKTNNKFMGELNTRALAADGNSLSGYLGVYWYQWDKKSSAYFWNDPNTLTLN